MQISTNTQTQPLETVHTTALDRVIGGCGGSPHARDDRHSLTRSPTEDTQAPPDGTQPDPDETSSDGSGAPSAAASLAATSGMMTFGQPHRRRKHKHGKMNRL